MSGYWAACEALRQYVASSSTDDGRLRALEQRVDQLEKSLLAVKPSTRTGLLTKVEFISCLLQKSADDPEQTRELMELVQRDIAAFLDRKA